MLLLEIRQINIESIDLDDAVAALAAAKMYHAEYAANGIPAPDWLGEKVGEIQREVKARHRDYLERALKAARARQATFKTREQKAAEAQAEIERLEKLLG